VAFAPCEWSKKVGGGHDDERVVKIWDEEDFGTYIECTSTEVGRHVFGNPSKKNVMILAKPRCNSFLLL